MVREILKIRTDNGLGDNNPTFKDIEITEYNAKFPRMGMPSLSATLKWDTPLDDEWTRKEYVTLRGERFYIRHTPSGKKDNQDSRYNHEIEFTSEFAEILGNTYFMDVVPDANSGVVCATRNKPCSNNTKFTFYGTISEFVDRLNCAFLYAKIGDSKLNSKTSLTTNDTVTGDGYCAMLDADGVGSQYDPNKTYEFSFEDKYLWDAITEGYNKTEIPFERRGRKIIFGALPKVVTRKFEYGHDNELLSVYHKNANAKVINRITMFGSSENIPHYYPNETEYGHINIVAKTGNNMLTAGHVQIVNMTQLLSRLNADNFAVLKKSKKALSNKPSVQVDSYSIGIQSAAFQSYTLGKDVMVCHEPGEIYCRVLVNFKLNEQTKIRLTKVNAKVWQANDSMTLGYHNCISTVTPILLHKMTDGTYSHRSEILSDNVRKMNDGTLSLGTLEAGFYSLAFKIFIDDGSNTFTSFINIEGVDFDNFFIFKTEYYWQVGEKRYDGVGSLGVKLTLNISDAMVGDGFGWTASGRMPFQDHLVPPKYRNTLGAERFYNALNAPYSEEYATGHPDAYLDPDTNQPYLFPNPYIEGAPSEHIYRNEEIKPTIEGVTNADGQLMGVIADIAYDADDNDALKAESTEDGDKNDTLKYEHSFFYIKLNIFNGDYGFDLFAHASQTDAMTIQMRDGSCNGCKFKIQAVKFTDETGLETYKNPIVVQDGKAVGVVSEDGIKESDLDPTQQNTQTHSIWICVQKDAETFGVIMPNKSNNFKPAIGDKFNIINIDLPQVYILAAEKRMEEEGIRFMADNNEEKFTFDIQASRIFLAENPQVLAQLDEYSKIKVKYNGKTYEQYVNQLTIDCKDSEALPNIGIDLTDTLAVGQSFVDQVAERASSLIANPYTMGGALGAGGGLTTALADMRYLKKSESDRSKGQISSDIGFEVGEFISGGSGGIFYQDPETGQTYIEADKLKIRMKAIFEELEIAKVSTIGGKFIITPGGGITISFVEELTNSYRCYFKGKDEDKGADCRFIVGDQVQCHEFNISEGIHHNASNRYYWRLVTAVNNAESYIELSKNDCDNALGMNSDAPIAGDTIVQLGNRTNDSRQSAIVLSTVDAFAPCMVLYNKINHYSLEGKEVVSFGYNKASGDVFFRLGSSTDTHYLDYTQQGGLEVAGKISVKSTYGDKALGDYIDESSQSAADAAKAELQGKIAELQNQIDGVIETFNGVVDPTKTNEPASGWTTELDKQAHIGDVYFNIGAYNASTNPNAGHAWRWYYNSPTDYGWVEIADSDAVRALQLAQMSVLDTDVLYRQTESQTDAPATPTVNTSGTITDLKGWSTDAPEWQDGKYIWQTTYVKKGDGSATFSDPTCISGRNGADGANVTISSQSVKYSTNHGATQPADNTFTLNAVPTNLKAGDYLWSRTEVTYSNGQSTKSYAVSRIGTNGTNATIKSSSVTYAKTTTNVQPADSEFTATTIGALNIALGEYLWTKTTVTYSDNTPVTSYSVSRIGSDGDTTVAGLHIAYATDITGSLPHPTAVTDFATSMQAGKVYQYMGIYTDDQEADSTDFNDYEWAKFKGADGDNAKSVIITGEQIFEYKDNFTSSPTPTSIILKATLQNTTGYQWSYKTEGATSFKNIGITTQTLMVAAGNTTYFPSGAKSCVFRCTSGGMYDEMTIAKVSSGTNGDDGYTVLLTNESHIFKGGTQKAEAGSATCEIIAYRGATKMNATIGTISGMPTGMTVAITNNGTQSAKFTVSVTDALTKNVATSGTLNVPITVDGKVFNRTFSWSLSLDGRGITGIVEEYAINNSATTAPADSEFSTAIKTMTDAKPYLWNREKTTYSDNTSETTQAIMIGVKGQNGEPGATVVSVTNWYLATNTASGVKITDTGWVTDASHANATTDATKPYLWNYEVTKWSKGADTKTDPHVVGKYGKDGVTPRITEQYFLSTSSTQLLPTTNEWQDTKPDWIAGHYYWTRSKIDYGDGDIEFTAGICVTPENGTSVLAEYSATGGSNDSEWHPAFVSGDVWMRTSSDGGQNWSPAMMIVGSDYANNMLLKSDEEVTNGNYNIKNYNLAEVPVIGETYTFTLWGTLASTKNAFRIYNDNGSNDLTDLVKVAEGIYRASFKWIDRTGSSTNKKVMVYVRLSSQSGISTINKVKLEKGNNPNPQWTPAASEMVGKWRKFQWGVTTSSTSADGITDWKDTPMTANPGYYVWMRSGMVVPPATEPASYDPATRITGDKGAKGDTAYRLDLTDEMKGIACDAKGNPIPTSIPTSQASVWKGSTKVTSGITYSIAQTDGVSATVTSAGVVTPTALTKNNATIVVQAVVDGVTLQSNISIYKVIPGEHGADYTPNIILKSNEPLNTNSYLMNRYDTDEDLEANVDYTVTIWGSLGSGKSYFGMWFNGGNVKVCELSKIAEGVYSGHGKVPSGTAITRLRQVDIYQVPSSSNATSRIDKIKLERGVNSNPQWTPAASEMEGAVVYQLEPSVDNITKSMKGELSATSVNCSVYKVTGNSPRELTSEKTVKMYDIKYDGSTVEYTKTPTNGVTSGVAVTQDTEAILCQLWDGNVLLDSERVPVVSDASDMEVSTRNLIADSKFLQVTNASGSNWANVARTLASGMKSGKDYVVAVKSVNGGNTGTLPKGKQILISFRDSQGTVNDVIFDCDSKYARFTANRDIPAGSNVFFYCGVPNTSQVITSFMTISEIMLVRGNVVPADWTPAPEDVEKAIGKNDYLQKALKEDSHTEGGLIIATTMLMGENNTDYTTQTTWSGINGAYMPNAVGGGIASFYGGDMYDLAEYYNWSESEGKWNPKSGVTIPSRIAKGVDRMDGSGYKAGGNLWWTNTGDTTFVGTIIAKGEFAGVRKNRRTVITSANQSKYIKANELGVLELSILSTGCYIWIESLNTDIVITELPMKDFAYVGETIVICNHSTSTLGIGGHLMTEENYLARNTIGTESISLSKNQCFLATCGVAHNKSTNQGKIVWYYRKVTIDLDSVNG